MKSPFFKRKYKCPICLKSFTSLTVRSSAIYVEKRESDFHNVYKGVSPLHYSIIVCPQCEYAASNTTFNKELSMDTANQLAAALVKLKSNETVDFTGERKLDITLRAFKQAIITAQLKQVASDELSGLLLAAAWIARESNDKDLEATYLEEALKHYLKAYNTSSGKIGNLSDLQVTYLIGELYRRCGQHKEAIKWFNQVISHKNIKSNPNIEKLAREQWSLAREEAKGLTSVEKDTGKIEVAAPDSIQAEPTPHSAENDEDESNENASYKRRTMSTMQFLANLYPDQIEWLKTISNQGYKNTDELFPREAVLRSIIDLIMEKMGENIPTQFTTEEELKDELAKLLLQEKVQ